MEALHIRSSLAKVQLFYSELRIYSKCQSDIKGWQSGERSIKTGSPIVTEEHVVGQAGVCGHQETHSGGGNEQ